jgi:uncharacterized integral membrane protein
MTPKAWTIMIVSMLAIIIMLQNLSDVSVQILLWRIEIPLVLLILLTIVIGFIIGYFLSSMAPKKRR